MRKGKYIDIYVIMACLSHKKPSKNLQVADELIQEALNSSEQNSVVKDLHENVNVNEEMVVLQH